MFHLRYLFKLTFAYVYRLKWGLVLGIILGFGVFFAIRLAYPYIVVKKERIAVEGRYHTDNLPLFIQRKISKGLTSINEEGHVVPSVAASWETPDSGRTWIFTLSDNYLWQDKTPVTSEDIHYEFEGVKINHPDDKTIAFELEEPFTPFPSVVSRPTFKKGLLGVGEWKVDKITLAGDHVQRLTLVKVDPNGKKQIPKEEIIYKFYPTLERTKMAFKLGEVDKVLNLLETQPFNNWHTLRLNNEVNYQQAVTIFINNQDPVLSDKSIRQALNYAINKEKLGERAISPISPKSWAYNPQVKRYPYDPERAQEVINELPEETKNNLEVKLVSTPTQLEVAEKVARAWNDIGVKTTVQVSSIVPGEFQAYITILEIPTDPDQYPIWHSTQNQTNISGYANQRIDKLLEDGRVTLDIEERKRLYLDFQRFLLEDVPAIFLYHPTYYTVERK